jgi:uncharacterized protein YndB with AHSA1/START domain
MDNSKPKHVYQVWIRTTPERLWQALVDPELTQQYFFGSRVESDFQPGSPIAHTFDGVHALDGKIIDSDPPRKLVTTFEMTHHETGKNDKPSRVTWLIEPDGEMCRLTLTHDEFEGETDTYRGVVSGWAYILSGLKTVLETGTSLPSPQTAM